MGSPRTGNLVTGLSGACASLDGSLPERFEHCPDCGVVEFGAARKCRKNDVYRAKSVMMLAEKLADLALDPVSLHGAPGNLAGNGDPQPGMLQAVLGNEQRGVARADLAAPAEYSPVPGTVENAPAGRKIHPLPVRVRRSRLRR